MEKCGMYAIQLTTNMHCLSTLCTSPLYMFPFYNETQLVCPTIDFTTHLKYNSTYNTFSFMSHHFFQHTPPSPSIKLPPTSKQLLTPPSSSSSSLLVFFIMISSLHDWPEPVIRVQTLSENGATAIPPRYIKPPSERPSLGHGDEKLNIPIIDLSGVDSEDDKLHATTMNDISKACREWGFFQVVNHGVCPDLMRGMRDTWREFFHLPLELKQDYANTPKTYEGYGSRLGVQKGAVLDWSDYFFLNYLPSSLKNHNKWPAQPHPCRELTEEYGKQVVNLCGKLMKILSINLGLQESHLQDSFGGKDIGACMRVNFYPKCPQPGLTLGLSSHSDPGGMTILLPDENVSGLQVCKDDTWVTVNPAPDAFIINIGDQIQVLSNAIYKSVEHRVIVNSAKERVSLAFFYNPKGDIPLEPAKELVTPDRPALYQPMTYDEYRQFIRMRGPSGKSQVESLKSPAK